MADNNPSNMDKSKVIQARKIRITTNEDKTRAYITIDYLLEEKGRIAPIFKLEEIRNELSRLGIIFGIKEDNLQKCCSEEKIENLLIAEGEKAEEGQDDVLDIKFEIDSDIKKLHEDNRGRIDFRNIGAVNSVFKEEVVAVRIPGKEGTAGKDVFGKSIKPKPIKRVLLKAGQGCELKNENTVIASVTGKPCMRNNSFFVYSMYDISKDVDLSTGNVSFLGDIKIGGSVKEGMKVIGGNCIDIGQNVEGATVKSRNHITIHGNVINSTVIGSGEDSEKINELEQLREFHKLLMEMIMAIEEIKKFNLLGYETTDGQIVKLLIDSKFKGLPMACMRIISQAVKYKQQDDNKINEAARLVKEKLIGLAPINIRHYSEIIDIANFIKTIIEENKCSQCIPVNVKLSYCQESTIFSSGDIIFSGKGSYVSSITSQSRICFIQDKSIVRGGTLKAENEINCKIAGSPGRVTTRLMVSEKGNITSSVAYENTILVVGNKEHTIEYACKNLKAYLNEDREIVVESLRL